MSKYLRLSNFTLKRTRKYSFKARSRERNGNGGSMKQIESRLRHCRDTRADGNKKRGISPFRKLESGRPAGLSSVEDRSRHALVSLGTIPKVTLCYKLLR